MTSPPPTRPRVVTGSPYLSVPDSRRSLSASPSSSPESSPFIPSSLPAQWPTPRPSVSRANSHVRSFSQSVTSSTRPSPYLLPQGSSLNMAQPRRLLMPTVRPTRQHIYCPSPKIPPSKTSPAKLGRSRAGSLVPMVEDQLELDGYQIYAVEKWVVERKRPVTVLTVYTGNPKQRITVTALSPLSSLSAAEAQAEWDKAIYQLRRDGAKPRETDKGMVMVTSLANFRSDYTIVHIPRGSFLDVQEQLYTNIDVLRMGCSGRSALTLEEPSDTTKDRFISMYYISEKTLTRAQELFNPTVLELVKLIQAALAIYGMFDLAPDERNGLLCDVTYEGIQRWIAEIGEPCIQVEPTERIADPSVVAALFSMILTIRNKLHALGYSVPKDPFIDPAAFIRSLTTFQNSNKPHDHKHTLSLPHYNSPLTHPSSSTLPSSNNTPSASTANISSISLTFLSQSLIQAIQTAYDKFKQSESYKVHKVLINKLDDLATDLRTNPEAHGRSGGWGGLWNNALNNPTTDLDALVRVVILGGSSKDGVGSLRYLWTGRPQEVARKRLEKERLADNEEKENEAKAEKDGREKGNEKDNKASDEEPDTMGGKPWSGRVQKKIESWAALGRTKKLSADLGSKMKPWVSPESPLRSVPATQPLVPSVVISRDPADEEDILSSGQVSPVSDSQARNSMLHLGALPPAAHSADELSDYDRRVSEFNHRRPPMKPHYQTRIISWSDPVTALDIIDDGGIDKRRGSSPLGRSAYDGLEDVSTLVDGDEAISESHRTKLLSLRGRRSFDDAERLRGTRILPVERMRIDVELCGQLLIMHRREQHLANVLACLQALTQTLETSNTTIRNDFKEHQSAISELDARAVLLQQIETLRSKADVMTQETNALAYESAQFQVDDLYHMASQPRMKVFELREKVFGTGRRLRQGVHGAHGQFNRVQWTIDGRERLVDMWGRTEIEAEEEVALPGAHVVVPEEAEREVVEHQSLKPTWVLRFFNYFGSKWGGGKDHKPTGKGPDAMVIASSPPQTESKGRPDSGHALSSSVEWADGRTKVSRHNNG
ncbi:unnamed protein product [Somion occarium]|uniref:STB6-like N-terminal domain-containing protein n=1 Tax=Somion occarium TaxID=3059160 RepID=A0ABP1D0I9_9APHY